MTSSRWTTAPGEIPRSVPRVKALRSVWVGRPPLCRRSESMWPMPRRTLRPPVSKARFTAARVAEQGVGARQGAGERVEDEPRLPHLAPVGATGLVRVDEAVQRSGDRQVRLG